MSEKDFRLTTPGRRALAPPAGAAGAVQEALDELLVRRRKLALLAVLAVEARPLSRDLLVGMFWGDQDERRARHSLSDALSHLRRVLGRDAISVGRSEVALAPATPLVVDAVEIARAAAAGDHARVVALHAGPFLDDVHVDGSSTFAHWADRHRARLAARFRESCRAECARLTQAGDSSARAMVASRWLDAEPLSPDAALCLLDALAAAGTAEGDAEALAAYAGLEARLAREYESAPDARVAERAAAIRARVVGRGAGGEGRSLSPNRSPIPSPIPGPVPTLDRSATEIQRLTGTYSGPTLTPPRSHPDPTPTPPRPRPRRTRRTAAIAATLLVLLAVLGATAVAAWRRGREPAAPAGPVVAVASIDVAHADSSLRWLADGLPQMLAARLSRASDVAVVLPSRVRQLRERAELPAGAAMTPAQLRDLGRRVGATIVVSGALVGEGSMASLEIALLDARSGRVTHLDVVADSSVIALADRAAVRLLDAIGASASGPRLADIETSSVEAYRHYVRYHQLAYERPTEAYQELDAAIALDSGFTSAVLAALAVAMAGNDGVRSATLNASLARLGTRVPERDRLDWEARMALSDGDLARSQALGEMLVRRWPLDPRGYTVLADVYAVTGRWQAQDSVLQRLLALDSLAMEAGRGACSACFAYSSLVDTRIVLGDLAGAERAARRWVALTPSLNMAWTALGLTHAYQEHPDAALAALARARELAPDEPWTHQVLGWTLVMSRRLDSADSLVTALGRSDARWARMLAGDLRSVVLRERGRFRAADSSIARTIAEYPELTFLQLVRANAIARAGDCAGAVRAYEWMHGPGPARTPQRGGEARGFAWHHALLADALASAPAGARCDEVAMLPALADSVERIGRLSYYGRDWRLHHHIRGLIAERAGDWARAEREFAQARWVRGDAWTRTTTGLARVQLAQGRTHDAIATLREAYHSRPDAMGRYQPRSEIDLMMSRAFAAAGMHDSASVYLAYARAAWKDADPEMKRLLER